MTYKEWKEKLAEELQKCSPGLRVEEGIRWKVNQAVEEVFYLFGGCRRTLKVVLWHPLYFFSLKTGKQVPKNLFPVV